MGVIEQPSDNEVDNENITGEQEETIEDISNQHGGGLANHDLEVLDEPKEDIIVTEANHIPIESAPPVEDSNPYESIDAMTHNEHQESFRGGQGVESDPAHQMMDNYMPGWLHETTHGTAGLHGDRIALLVIVALTLLLIHLINSCMDRSAREAPLIRRLAEMDKKLFASSNELLLLRKEGADGPPPSSEPSTSPAVLRSLEVQVEQARAETEKERRRVVEAEARVAQVQEEVERSKQETSAAVEETQQAQAMVEELLQEKAKLQEGGGADKQLPDVVQQLQSQLEGQRGLLLKYEPKLKKKEKEAKELTKEVKQMKADVANANLEADKLRRQLDDMSKTEEQHQTTLEELNKQQEEWKSLSDLLQSQLDAKSEEVVGFEEKLASLGEELSSTKSRMLLFKNEAESKEEQLEILQETLEELQQRKSNKKSENGDENGWDDDGTDGWEVEDVVKDVAEAKEVATLRIESKKAAEARDALQEQVTKIQARLEEVESAAKEEAATLREVRDEVVKDRGDVQRRLDVLTEFFNKKEAELQEQLGLQSAKFGDVSTDAESTARKLISVTSELDSTGAQVKLLRAELEDHEKSLKASVAAQEKKAHENWVAARQAERRLTEVQSEMSVLRNRLTVAESKNTLLEQEKEDLSGAVTMLQQNANKVELPGGVKPKTVSFAGDPTELEPQNGQGETRSASNPPSESGLQASSPGPSSLPPLPGLPSLPGMLPPAMSTMPNPMFPSMPGMMSLDSRPPPIGRMSPPTDSSRNRSFAASRSPSPDSYDRGGYRRSSYRDSSPTSRSERRLSPRRPSPTRSERGYRDRRDHHDYRDRDSHRYYSSNGRDTSPDRYSDRSHRSDRGSSSRYSPREERDRPAAAGGRADHLKTNTPGPKTSSPMDPHQGSRNYGAHV